MSLGGFLRSRVGVSQTEAANRGVERAASARARGRLARRVKRTDVTGDSSSRAVFRSTAPRTPPAPPTNSEECGKKPPQEETGDEAKTKALRRTQSKDCRILTRVVRKFHITARKIS